MKHCLLLQEQHTDLDRGNRNCRDARRDGRDSQAAGSEVTTAKSSGQGNGSSASKCTCWAVLVVVSGVPMMYSLFCRVVGLCYILPCWKLCSYVSWTLNLVFKRRMCCLCSCLALFVVKVLNRSLDLLIFLSFSCHYVFVTYWICMLFS